jgi:acyl phosphate:glycerol-3-phosphate acyltransferase
MIKLIIFIAIAYAIGSLSSAIIVCKLLGLPDPRTQGSKNPGATNVLRIGGKIPAIITLIGDVLKGAIPVMLARVFNVEGFALGIVAIAAFAGHLYPIFFGFKGGKGVATALGALLGLSAILGVAMIITWIIVAALFRYSSLAALIAAVLAPIYAAIFTHGGYFIPVLIITLVLIWKHWDNIARLRAGTESKISF